MNKSSIGVLALTLAFVALGLAILPELIITAIEDRETLQEKLEQGVDTIVAELEGKPKTDPLITFGLASIATALIGLVLGVVSLVRKEDMRVGIAAVVLSSLTLVLFMA